MRLHVASIAGPATAILITLAAADAHAQAWVSDQGSLDLGLDYNFATSSKVVFESAEDFPLTEFPDAGTQSHQLELGVEYTPIRKLALNLRMPFVMLKYTGRMNAAGDGPAPEYAHAGGGSYDDGSFHGTLTDLRLGARYAVLEDPIAIAPHIGVSIPVADYETIGNTVAGRGLNQLHVGASAGYLITPETYAHVMYEFSFVERFDVNAFTERYNQNRSDLAVTIGRKLLDYQLDLNLGANYRVTHGGLPFSKVDGNLPNELLYHDVLLREKVLLVGGGAGYQLNNQLSVSASVRIFVDGENTLNNSIVGVGLAYSPMQ